MTIVIWACLFGAYMLFAGDVGAAELGTGVVAATLATALAVLWCPPDGRRLALRAPWPRLVVRPLAALLPDAWRVGSALVAAITRGPSTEFGTTQMQPFDRGDAGPASAGRRALVTLAVSFAPNGYVADLPDGEDALLVHRLRAAPPSRDRVWPL